MKFYEDDSFDVLEFHAPDQSYTSFMTRQPWPERDVQIVKPMQAQNIQLVDFVRQCETISIYANGSRVLSRLFDGSWTITKETGLPGDLDAALESLVRAFSTKLSLSEPGNQEIGIRIHVPISEGAEPIRIESVGVLDQFWMPGTAASAPQPSIIATRTITPTPTVTPAPTPTSTPAPTPTSTSAPTPTSTSAPTPTVTPTQTPTSSVTLTPVPPTPTSTSGQAGKLVSVQADKDWQDSGLDVQSGQGLRITYVSGRWSPWSGSYMDGNGCLGLSICSQDPNFPDNVYSFIHAGLIGRIAGETPFAIGNDVTLKAPSSGRIYLRINDKRIEDNSGNITVRVDVSTSPTTTP